MGILETQLKSGGSSVCENINDKLIDIRKGKIEYSNGSR